MSDQPKWLPIDKWIELVDRRNEVIRPVATAPQGYPAKSPGIDWGRTKS